jgi:hypothetical protein
VVITGDASKRKASKRLFIIVVVVVVLFLRAMQAFDFVATFDL